MAAVTRRQYKGAAAPTTTTNALSVSDTSVTLTATTGFPSAAGVPFFVVIDPGTSSEEKCSATISGSTLTLVRAQDDTTAAVHASGATIYPVFTADEADEANLFTSTMTTRGDLLTMGSGPTVARIALGASGRVLKSDGTDATWAISPETDLITTKGDLLVGTAADTLARQGVGSNGQVLVADSGVANGVAWVDPQTNRNVVINGAMQVAQRGTSTASITTNGYYTADRYSFNCATFGTWTQSIENDAPTGSGFRKSTKLLCTTADASPAAGDNLSYGQYLEGQNLQQFLKGTASAKQFSLSFWVKSNVTGTYIVNLYDADNTRSVSNSYTINASNTWEYKTITYPADTTGAFDNDNNLSLYAFWWLGAGTNFTSGTLNTTWAAATDANRAVGQTNLASAINNAWQITGVQLEAGSVATPFEFEDFGVTLAKCQRYFQKSFRQDVAPTTNSGVNDSVLAWQGTGSGFGSTVHARLPVTMRAAPTATLFNNYAANALARNVSAGVDIASVSSLAVSGALTVTASGTGDAIDQNIQIHYTLSSEL